MDYSTNERRALNAYSMNLIRSNVETEIETLQRDGLKFCKICRNQRCDATACSGHLGILGWLFPFLGSLVLRDLTRVYSQNQDRTVELRPLSYNPLLSYSLRRFTLHRLST